MPAAILRQTGIIGIVVNSRLVGEQFFDRDLIAAGIVRDIFRKTVLERKLLFLRQLQDDRGSELFGDRTYLEDRIGIIGCFRGFIFITVTLFQDNGSFARNEHGAAVAGHMHISVYEGVQTGGNGLGATRKRNRECKKREAYLFHEI